MPPNPGGVCFITVVIVHVHRSPSAPPSRETLYYCGVCVITVVTCVPPFMETHEGLGDVIARLAPFLKLYSMYTSGFEDAMKTLSDWTKRDKRFNTLIREFEVSQSWSSGSVSRQGCNLLR